MAKKIVSALMLLILIAVAAAVYSARSTRNRAALLIADLRGLQIGSSRIDRIQSLSSKYSSYAVPGCKQPECTAAFAFDNRWLARLHLAKPAVLGAGVVYQDGQLREIAVSTTCYGPQGGPPYVVILREALPAESQPAPFNVGGTYSEGAGHEHISVHLTPAATPEQRARAYAFNLHFLDHLGPCKDADDMLPGLQ